MTSWLATGLEHKKSLRTSLGAGAAAAGLAGIPYAWSAVVTYLNAWHAKRSGRSPLQGVVNVPPPRVHVSSTFLVGPNQFHIRPSIGA